ncbi:hypothetical protein D3C71_2070290 [compost metagenome]
MKVGDSVVPVFRKKSVLPAALPTRRSRSPSPSRSARTGAASLPMLERPKLLVPIIVKVGFATVFQPSRHAAGTDTGP